MAPDYDLEPTVSAETPAQLKAIADPIRTEILSLVLERAATVTELAQALDRPKSSTAYHVDQLVELGFLKVVRTRKVRAIEERFYGRVGRIIVIGEGAAPAGTLRRSFLAEAQTEAVESDDDGMLATIHYARIPRDRRDEFWGRVCDLAAEFTSLPRSGEVVYGFVAAVFPTDQPTLADPKGDDHTEHPPPNHRARQ
jgi:DNA-binding transcriptional ArsR family regulator